MTIEELLKTFNIHQKDMFDILNKNSKYQFRVPTGVGKGYVMMLHVLYRVIHSDDSKFVISSHRLSLNNQHLRDLIDFYTELGLLYKVKFLTVGSQALNINKLLNDDPDLSKKFNNQLFNYNMGLNIKDRITQGDIFKSTLSRKDVNNIVNRNDSDGFKTIIITTYNSLDKIKDQSIDTIYLDEAHTLASEKDDADFKMSYELIKSKNRFFFTATPKDIEDQLVKEGYSEIFLMNNKDIFGEVYEVSFKKCVESSYITRPLIHIAHPKELNGENYDSIENKSKFVKETFEDHQKWVKSVSASPDDIDAKVLVRCESVPKMWEMYDKLRGMMSSDIIICAGASYNDSGDSNHVINGEWYKNRDEFVHKIQDIPDTKKAIILNYDIFSEGINVQGITGVMFLQGKLPSFTKIIQNVGRSTRLHKIDRDLVRKGEISSKDYTKWVKPHCAVIIPYWDTESESTKKILSEVIRELRDNWKFDPHFIVSVGEDIADLNKNQSEDPLNDLSRGDKKSKLIKEIQQEIEKMDKEAVDMIESERIRNLSNLEFFELITKNK